MKFLVIPSFGFILFFRPSVSYSSSFLLYVYGTAVPLECESCMRVLHKAYKSPGCCNSNSTINAQSQMLNIHDPELHFPFFPQCKGTFPQCFPPDPEQVDTGSVRAGSRLAWGALLLQSDFFLQQSKQGLDLISFTKVSPSI